MARHFQLLILFTVFFSSVECAKLLGVFHVPARSHYLAESTLMKILPKNGHDVTIVSPFSEKNPPKNYKEVVLTGLYEESADRFHVQIATIVFVLFHNEIRTSRISISGCYVYMTLAHKNLKLFITHGGIFSTIEAVYHGIPLLGLGVIHEQIHNSKRAEKNGYAKSIPFNEIKEDILESYLNELLKNPRYKENAERRSRILKDKPPLATEAVNYWVEYVIRHKGAQHLRVASLNLRWYQYMLLDVVAFVLLILVVFIYAMKYLFKVVFRKNINKKEKTS